MSQKGTTDSGGVSVTRASSPSRHGQDGRATKLHRWRMAFFGLVILLAGVVIGGALMMIVAPHKLMNPPPGPETSVPRMIPRLADELGLSPEQVEKIEPILKEHMERLNEIRKDASVQITEALEQMNKQISGILTEEQLLTWKRDISRLQRPFGPGGPRYHRGPGEPNRPRKGPGPFGPGRYPEDPNRPRKGPGPFGPGRRPEDPNRPRNSLP